MSFYLKTKIIEFFDVVLNKNSSNERKCTPTPASGNNKKVEALQVCLI